MQVLFTGMYQNITSRWIDECKKGKWYSLNRIFILGDTKEDNYHVIRMPLYARIWAGFLSLLNINYFEQVFKSKTIRCLPPSELDSLDKKIQIIASSTLNLQAPPIGQDMSLPSFSSLPGPQKKTLAMLEAEKLLVRHWLENNKYLGIDTEMFYSSIKTGYIWEKNYAMAKNILFAISAQYDVEQTEELESLLSSLIKFATNKAYLELLKTSVGRPLFALIAKNLSASNVDVWAECVYEKQLESYCRSVGEEIIPEDSLKPLDAEKLAILQPSLDDIITQKPLLDVLVRYLQGRTALSFIWSQCSSQAKFKALPLIIEYAKFSMIFGNNFFPVLLKQFALQNCQEPMCEKLLVLLFDREIGRVVRKEIPAWLITSDWAGIAQKPQLPIVRAAYLEAKERHK